MNRKAAQKTPAKKKPARKKPAKKNPARKAPARKPLTQKKPATAAVTKAVLATTVVATKTAAKKSSTSTSPSSGRRDAGRPRGQPIVDVVLDRTLAELATHGLQGLSVDRIARAAEVNKTSIYRRFPTRDALVVAALSRVHDDVTAQLRDTGSLRGDLTALVQAVAAFLASDVGRAVARAVFAGPLAEDLVDVARARLAAEAALSVQELLARARARGEWRDDVDPAVLLAALVGALLHRVLLEQSHVDAEFVDGVVDLVIAGAAPKDRGARTETRRS